MVWDEISIDNDGRLSATLTEDPCDHGLGRVGEVISLIFLDVDTP
jgi:hypothetical protein